MKRATNKTKEINRRYALVLDTLDRLERGQYTGSLDIYWVGDSICWLWHGRCRKRYLKVNPGTADYTGVL